MHPGCLLLRTKLRCDEEVWDLERLSFKYKNQLCHLIWTLEEEREKKRAIFTQSNPIFLPQHPSRPPVLDGEEQRKPWRHSVFTLLSLIKNLSVPCLSLFYLNNAQSDNSLISVSPPEGTQRGNTEEIKQRSQNKIIQKYSEISFDLDWMNNKAVQQQTAKWHWCWQVVNRWGLCWTGAAQTQRSDEVV